MAYQAWSVVAGEQPSAAKWNIIGSNMAGFNDGTAIGNASIGPSKLATGAASATVAAGQTTASTTYVDLATVGPSVTVTIGANGLALVCMSLSASNTASDYSVVSILVSGANTLSAVDNETAGTWLFRHGSSTNDPQLSYVKLLTGLTAGSTTFKMQYRVASGTSTYIRRILSVIPF